MSNTPSRRLSLRRKRDTRSTHDAGSPATKKSSPSLENMSEDEGNQRSGSQVYTSRRTRSHSVNSPTQPSRPQVSPHQYSLRSPKGKGRHLNTATQERVLVTPGTIQQQHQQPDESHCQYSPDMPFLCSQLCGTQECEVIWDCDSPGFSKDDLKRMYNDGSDSEGVSSVRSPLVMPALASHRTLFPRGRTRSTTTTTTNTNAQLYQLLDQLSSTSGTGEVKTQTIEVQPLELPDSETEETCGTQRSTSSSSPQLPRLLQAASSQPFTVQDTAHQEKGEETLALEDDDVMNLAGVIDDSEWDDELNMGICDISGINLTSDTGSKPSVRGSDNLLSDAVSKTKTVSELVDFSCDSTDVFDDDLFTESAIQTTQAVEEAMIGTSKTKFCDNVVECKSRVESKYSDVFCNKDKYCSSTKEVEIDISVVHGKSMKTVTTCNNYCDLKKESSSCDDFSSNPVHVIGKPQMSPADKPPQRQVRNSFSLSAFGRNSQNKNVPSIQAHPTAATVKGYTNRNNMNILYQRTHTDTHMMTENPVKSMKMDQKSVINLGNSQTSTAQSMTNIPPKKLLFKNTGNSKFNVSRGPLLRSQSTGDATVTNSSTLVRRSNSFAEVDAIREFEEDEDIFKSLLSVLPEDDQLLEVQLFQSLENMSKYKGTSTQNDINHSLNSSVTLENLKKITRIGTGRPNASRASRDPLGNVTNGPVLTSHCENPVDSRTNKVDITTNKATITTPAEHPRPGPKEGTVILDQTEAMKTKPLSHPPVQPQANDILDDDLFEDDVLMLIDEVESQYGSQPQSCDTWSSQPSHSQFVKCTQDEIARKKEAAQRLRQERKQQRHVSGQYGPVC